MHSTVATVPTVALVATVATVPTVAPVATVVQTKRSVSMIGLTIRVRQKSAKMNTWNSGVDGQGRRGIS